MLSTHITELIADGENSKTEFKRDDVRPEQLAREIVSFANMNGGKILLGVEDDGTVVGIQRENSIVTDAKLLPSSNLPFSVTLLRRQSPPKHRRVAIKIG